MYEMKKTGQPVVLLNRQSSQAVRTLGEVTVNEQTHTLAILGGGVQIVKRSNVREVK